MDCHPSFTWHVRTLSSAIFHLRRLRSFSFAIHPELSWSLRSAWYDITLVSHPPDATRRLHLHHLDRRFSHVNIRSPTGHTRRKM